MAPISYLDKIIKTSATPIHLIRSKTSSGEACYYYLLATDEKIRAMQAAGSTYWDLNDYGKIIASGWGEPSDEVKAELKEKYNFDS